jgi:Spy/CpxP family protein refolding chaperone
MDWINQTKLKNWTIGLLLLLNVLTISVIWVQSRRPTEQPIAEPGGKAPESASLLRKALDLNEGQTARVESLLVARREQSKGFSDRSNELKRLLAEELFKDNPDTAFARSAANEIGEAESRIELIRFLRFHELISLCTPAQKQALKPIVIEVFGRKPPKDEIGEKKQPPPPRIPKGTEDTSARRKEQGEPPPGGNSGRGSEEQKNGPQKVDEKMEKYSRRLGLSEAQLPQLRSILNRSKERGETLRALRNPDRVAVEAEKEKIRKDEDDAIMQILTRDQKEEFNRMLNKRRAE